MIMDHYYDKWQQIPPIWPASPIIQPAISPEEVAEFKKLLERAREYDRKHNQPDCELAEKKAKVKDLAEKLGVEIDFKES